MSVAGELLSAKNPTSIYTSLPFKRPSSSAPSSFKFDPLFRPRVSLNASAAFNPIPIGFRVGYTSLPMRNSCRPLIVPFSAASHEESNHSEIEAEKDKNNHEASQEAWKQTLASFKEQALKMQSLSQEAYEIYSKKAMVILEETSEQLKIQADKARNDLRMLAKEVSEEGKEYLSSAAKNSPEEVKEIMETFSSSTDDLTEMSKVRDFYLGIPYGLLLSLGGFLSFMLTGSISAIRFGVIIGGGLLALAVSSLRSYKRGEPYALALKGQAAIVAIIFLREIRLLSQRPSFFTFFTSIISGAMGAFYIYRIMLEGKQSKGSDLGHGAEN